MIINKREAILWAAVDLMTENGFEKTSVSQIVKQAGVAQGTFYLYFQSKSELVLAIAQYILDDILKEADRLDWHTSICLKDFVSMITEMIYKMTLKHKALIGFCYSGTAHYAVFNEWENLYIPYYQWLRKKLLFYQAQGTLNAFYDLDYLSNFVIGLLEHSAEQMYLFERKASQENISKENIKQFIYKAIS